MKQYTIGFITGACLIASSVMFMGAQNQHENLGDITVNSIICRLSFMKRSFRVRFYMFFYLY